MTHEPTLEVRAEQPYVAIPIRVTLKEWGRANALGGEIFEWMSRKGVELAGPPFFRYWVIGDMEKEFSLEVGVPVGSAVSGDGRVIAGSMPGGSYATLVHTGHPDRLIHSHTALQDWASSQGSELKTSRKGEDEVWSGRFEFFLTDPNVEPDLEKWSIKIAYLVAAEDEEARS